MSTMESNETTLHKLSAAISDVDNGVNSFIDFVDENSHLLIWIGIATVVLVVLGCYVCPALQICMCFWKSGLCVCRGCCKRMRYKSLDG